MNKDIKSIFDYYKSILFYVDTDLHFWTRFVADSIECYKQRLDINTLLFQASFCTYNIEFLTKRGNLKTHKDSRQIKVRDLKLESENFFNWIRILALLKSYNALETVLLRSIWYYYFPTLIDPITNKKASDCLIVKIKNHNQSFGLTIDSRNNKFIIEFIKYKCDDFNTFIKENIRDDLNTTWLDFFDLISTLRNIIAHQGTVMPLDTINEIKSKTRDIFERHFKLYKNHDSTTHLITIEQNFSGFILIINDFTVNTIKSMAGNTDLSFLNLR